MQAGFLGEGRSSRVRRGMWRAARPEPTAGSGSAARHSAPPRCRACRWHAGSRAYRSLGIEAQLRRQQECFPQSTAGPPPAWPPVAAVSYLRFHGELSSFRSYLRFLLGVRRRAVRTSTLRPLRRANLYFGVTAQDLLFEAMDKCCYCSQSPHFLKCYT